MNIHTERSQILWLGNYTVSEHQLTLNYGLNDMKFNCTYWFDHLDFFKIRERFGIELFERIIFHSIAIESLKVCSLKPDYMKLGAFEKYYTEDFEKMWRKIFVNVWGQWRYQNNFPDYRGPEIIFENEKELSNNFKPIEIKYGETESIYFCGGGKDSLASMTLLDKISMKYDALMYTHSVYGNAKKQQKLIMSLLKHCKTQNNLTQWIFDDFLDCPVLQLSNPLGIHELIAAETPSSIFSSLFWVLNNGYKYMILGHERSADFGNLIWNRTGEDINHQWGKSREAEILINTYIQNHLVSNFTYFSILKPLYDSGIFQVVKTQKELVKYTHSCNLEKPWCCKCAKCAYVWLCYMAYLPIDEINLIFKHRNLLDDPDNEIWFRELLGLESHTPFECVGKKEEVLLCFEILKRKGYKGKAMDIYINEVKNIQFEKIIQEHLIVDEDACTYPEEFKEQLLKYLNEVVSTSKQEIKQFILD